MTGTKYGCGIAACGACTVHVDGVATRSCVVPVSLIGNRPIVTIEAIDQDPVGRAVQDAWVSHDVVQCGYCQSGQIMSAVALLKSNPKPTDTNIEESMGENICRLRHLCPHSRGDQDRGSAARVKGEAKP
jgi:aerobic-type carbon monoxide dehydrogenase small subunit (CoxS/CutS family)